MTRFDRMRVEVFCTPELFRTVSSSTERMEPLNKFDSRLHTNKSLHAVKIDNIIQLKSIKKDVQCKVLKLDLNTEFTTSDTPTFTHAQRSLTDKNSTRQSAHITSSHYKSTGRRNTSIDKEVNSRNSLKTPGQAQICMVDFETQYSVVDGGVFTVTISDYSKRVYQGVRVKHTVKDLLAEKRSRQTSGPRYSHRHVHSIDMQAANRSANEVVREDRPLRLHTSRCQVRLNTNTPLIFVIHHWISLDHKSANTVSIGSTIVRILTRECEVVMTKMTLGFVWSPAGSHMLPSYYGMRRPFISDSDFASVKQFSPDVYSSALGGKPLGCDPSTMTSYSSLIDSYYPEAFGDYRSAATFSSSGGSFLPSSALSSLLPPFSGESSHLFPRDSWDQSVPEPVSQVEALCPDSLASVSVPPSMPSPEPPGSPSQYRSNSRGSSMCSVPGSQPYTLHSLEDAHYHSLTGSSSYPAAPSSSFSCTPYMSSSASDLVSKMVTEEDGSLPANGEASWAKEDGRDSWDQSVPEPVSQVEALCPDSLASVSVPPSMPSPEPPGSPSQYRSNSRGSSMCSVPGSQPYTLHSLEDAHYHSLTGSSSYPAAPSSSFSCTPYMSSSASDLVSKMVTEEDGSLPANGEASWAKEDGSERRRSCGPVVPPLVQRSPSAGKTRVYQGVRVKTTVKELLQRLRAREANGKKLKPAPGSPPESRKLCSPADHSSYSPQDSFSSSSSSCYDSPTRMESSHHGFASEHCHYQHCDLQDCYCLPRCRPGQQESFAAPEYTPHYAPTDYPYACQVEENYFMRDLQIPEMCYNIL
ncbi:hypothetical protein F2P81_017026 [Scophthalmus maximus]|uniref:OCA domain-containing protein n=1 Tax=Scophthalmus maximus TaxID=52904 RepID=A0A6A4SCV3_SCOMX|nr:hypothetical protein F2P81_017026 [Scophthalmus maximus]